MTDKQKGSVDARHAKAFQDLEGAISDLVHMGEIAAKCAAADDKGKAIFATTHLSDLLVDFQRKYYAAWKGRKVFLGACAPAQAPY